MEEVKISRLIKLLLKFWPSLAVKLLARKQGIKNSPFERLHDIFSKAERIDIFPYKSGGRGFIVVLDQKTALYFNQDGDRFVYDGFEVGKYEKGDVTIFDYLFDRD